MAAGLGLGTGRPGAAGPALPKAFPGLTDALAEPRYRLLIQSGGVLALLRTPTQGAPRRLGLVVPVGEVSVLELSTIPPGCGPE